MVSVNRRTFFKTATGLSLGTLVPASLTASEKSVPSVLQVWSCGGLAEAFIPANQRYEEKTGIKAAYTGAFAAALGKSLLGSATTEIFAARVLDLAKKLRETGRMVYFKPLCFTSYLLVTPKGNPAGISDIRDLARPGIRVILAPDASPPGGQAVTGLLKKAGILEQAMKNTVIQGSCVHRTMEELVCGKGDVSVKMPETMDTHTINAQSSVTPAWRVAHVTLWRRITQIAGLAAMGQWSFYGIFRCPFIVPYVSCQNCPVITCHGRLFTFFWGFWLLLPLSVLLFGRAFCGWVCPGGFANQLLGTAAPLKLRTRHIATRTLPYIKYLSLALALYVWLFLGQPREVVPIRVGDFFSSVRLTFEHANVIWLVRTFFVLGLLAAGLVLSSVWCRFVCPTGGLLDMFKKFSLFKVYKTDACNDCDKCLRICDMGTRPEEANCTNCCDCLPVCPQNAIKIGTFRRR